MLWSFFRFHQILIQWKKYWKHDVTYEESDYSEESARENEVFYSTILHLHVNLIYLLMNSSFGSCLEAGLI